MSRVLKEDIEANTALKEALVEAEAEAARWASAALVALQTGIPALYAHLEWTVAREHMQLKANELLPLLKEMVTLRAVARHAAMKAIKPQEFAIPPDRLLAVPTVGERHPPATCDSPTVLVVVARYREDVSWLTQLPKNVGYHIMQKEALLPELDSRAQTLLPNVGRESHSYLRFFQSASNAGTTGVLGIGGGGGTAHMMPLPRLLICAQGDPFDHNPRFLEEVASLSEGVARGHTPHFMPLGVWKGGERIIYCDGSGAPHQSRLLPIASIWRHLFGNSPARSLPPWLAFTPGACFAVARDVLFRCPIARFDAALSDACRLCTSIDPIAGHAFERLWMYFFLSEEEIGALVHHLASLNKPQCDPVEQSPHLEPATQGGIEHGQPESTLRQQQGSSQGATLASALAVELPGSNAAQPMPSRAVGAHAALVDALQDEFLAHDLTPPPEAIGWSEQRLHAWFEHGGEVELALSTLIDDGALTEALQSEGVYSLDALLEADLSQLETTVGRRLRLNQAINSERKRREVAEASRRLKEADHEFLRRVAVARELGDCYVDAEEGDVLPHTTEPPPLPSHGGHLEIRSGGGEIGGRLWPSAGLLCRYLRDTAQMVMGKSVIELGAGVTTYWSSKPRLLDAPHPLLTSPAFEPLLQQTGLVGLYAAGLGARQVLLTDVLTRGGEPNELERVLRGNIERNRLRIVSAATAVAADAPVLDVVEVRACARTLERVHLQCNLLRTPVVRTTLRDSTRECDRPSAGQLQRASAC